MTNAEKMRAMSNEELADYISEFCDCDHGRCPIQYYPISCIKGCREAWLKYLVREDD